MTNNTIVNLFLAVAEKCKDNIAFNYFEQSWQGITYGEFLGITKGIAAHLLNSGTRKEDRVAIVSENRYEWGASYLAILMAGGICVPIDAQLGPSEVENLLNDSEAVTVFYSKKTLSNIRGTARKICFDSSEFREICNTPAVAHCPELSEHDIASIVYTSGTTGIPKGVMLSHRNFCADYAALIGIGLVTQEDNVLSVLPLHHAYPFMCTFLVPLLLGATITYPAGMKGPELISAMKEKGVTVLVAVPQLLELVRNGILRKFREMSAGFAFLTSLLLKLCGFLRTGIGVNPGRIIFGTAYRAFGERFRFFASGGARLDPRIMKDLEGLGFTVLEGYGLTETSPVATFNPIRRRKPGSVGTPVPSVRIKIVNPSESGDGDIAIKGPMVMKGYYRKPEATAEVMRNGWFLTGDLGHLDEDGYLFITGRVKEVIVLSSGKNVYPEDVEKEYISIPLIKEICVSGMEERGVVESLHGAVVPDFEYARREKIGNVHDALKWELNKVSLKLPPYMRIKGFSVYSEPLPRTRLGKLKRYQIAELIKRSPTKVTEGRKEDKALQADETGKRVVACIAPILRESMPVHSADNLELDLGLDSLQRIELVVAIEKEFFLKLPETFLSEVQTVRELVTKLKELRTEGAWEYGLSQDVLLGEIRDKDELRVGLKQGEIEWRTTVFLLGILRAILRIFFSMEARGIENLPKPPFIIAPNHCSNMDGFVVGTAVPSSIYRMLYFQGFQTYFTGWWLPSLFGRLGHAIPIDPETFLSSAFRMSSYVLSTGRILCIFPEGGRSFDGDVMEFKKGIGILAMKHEVPIVPALIEGTFKALPRGSFWPRFRKVRITFGKPFHSSELDLSKKPNDIDNYQFIANEVRQRVKGLKTLLDE